MLNYNKNYNQMKPERRIYLKQLIASIQIRKTRAFEKSGVPNEIRTRVIAVKGRCPRPLDDGDSLLGGDKRDRTADLLHAMQALSQLSYTPKKRAHYNELPYACKATLEVNICFQ